ncbi:TraX family protein [Paenibacillus sp. SYP-B4298]|uniref:TraX family protein n=1 Tax=Paenibacillus sp. SYP-B4298 TaxID=2996034 RepID=UPI0022DE123C|nr:TraX family protein [Paenibacillus sp. SYP-B4298]
MQIIAMLTMLIDHIGVIFYPEESFLRILGRLSFPLYAFALVRGYYHTSNMPRYLLRLAILAAVSQLPYQWALLDDGVNVVAALLVCLLALLSLDRFKHPAAVLGTIAGAALLLELLQFDYGYYGLALVLIYRYTRGEWQLLLHLLLNVAVAVEKGWAIQMFSLLSTATLLYTPQLYRSLDKVRVPRLLWLSFYPAHLIALGLVREIMLAAG